MSRQQVRTTGTYRNNAGNAYRNSNYIEGNTVRKLAAMPERAPQETREPERDRRVERQTRANRERAMQMSPGYILFLTLAVFVTVGVCAMYIKLQSEVNTRMRHIAYLESQVLDLRTDNDATLNRIETSVNMEDIRDTAMNDLGMVYPNEDQIVCFEVDTNDYMNQYQDIPVK